MGKKLGEKLGEELGEKLGEELGRSWERFGVGGLRNQTIPHHQFQPHNNKPR